MIIKAVIAILANHRLSFGFLRAEILGATMSIIIIWILTTMLVMIAIRRIIDNDFNVRLFIVFITYFFFFHNSLVQKIYNLID